MTLLLHPVFLVCSFVFTLHQLLQKGWQLTLPWADAYLDSLLCMPIVLTLYLAEQLWRSGQKKQSLSALEIVIATVHILIVTEVFFPLPTSRFTADVWDVFFTALGTVFFHYTINPPASGRKKSGIPNL